mgnify:FL=1
MTGKNKIIKFISVILIISIIMPVVLFSSPQKARATVPTAEVGAFGWISKYFQESTAASSWTTALTTVKDWAAKIAKEVMKAIAKKILAKMTQATINWINSDFHGQPLFLTHPDSFFRDIAKSGLKDMVNIFGYNNLLYPFGRQFALNAINSYKSKLAQNAAYTLGNVMDSAQLRLYLGNFNYGGWNGFLNNTQYPQNNYLGFNMIATEELARRIKGTVQSAADKVQSTLQQGMGFLSPEKCTTNPKYNNGTNEFQKPSLDTAKWEADYKNSHPIPSGPSGSSMDAMDKWDTDFKAAEEKAIDDFYTNNTCPKKADGTSGFEKTTPGFVAATQVTNALNMPGLTTALDGALGNSLAAIFDALLNHFLDKGLNAMANKINPAPSIDNWSYSGNTLTGGTATTTATTVETLNIPQNVSVTVGQTTSTTISGGSGTYSIQPQSNASLTIAIATVDISGSLPKLKVTGVAKGTTSVIAQDSSSPIQTITVTITVSNMGDIVVTPANISTDVGAQVTATMSGGTEPYSIQTSPNETNAIATFSGNNLIVFGMANGTTFVDIKDSSAPAKTVRVKILVGPNILIVDPSSVSVYTGEVVSVPISNGTAPYFVTNQQNINVATGEILSATPNILTVTGRAEGTSVVTITDSSTPAKTTIVKITVSLNLTITPSNVTLYLNSCFLGRCSNTANLTISNGTAPYFVTNQQDPTVATAQVLSASYGDSILTVTGLKAGTSVVTVEDSSAEAIKHATVNITVVNN